MMMGPPLRHHGCPSSSARLGFLLALLSVFPLASGIISYCDYDSRRRRLLLPGGEDVSDSNSFAREGSAGAIQEQLLHHDEPLHSYWMRCNAEAYELQLDVDVHFSLFAAPIRREAWESCEPL